MEKTRTRSGFLIAILSLGLGLLPGCGAGIVGLTFLLSESDEASGPDPGVAVSELRLTHIRRAPAQVGFVLTDRGSRTADVEVTFDCNVGNHGNPCEGVIAQLSGLSSSPSGEEYWIDWDYAPVYPKNPIRSKASVRIHAKGFDVHHQVRPSDRETTMSTSKEQSPPGK